MFKKILASAATLLLGAGLAVVAVAAPASAHTPTYKASCDNLTFTPTQYDNPNNSKPNNAKITIDNKVVFDQNFGTSLPTQTFTYAGDVTHTWKIVIDAPGTTYDKTFTGTTTTCPITPAAPSATPPTCDVAGTLVIPTQAHVTFSGGTNGAGPGTYTIKAAAQSGYTLTGTKQWTAKVLPKSTDPKCNETPVTTPTVTKITQCGTYGSIVATDTDKIDYTITADNGQSLTNLQGAYTVTAVAKAPYKLTGYPAGGWKFTLNAYFDCTKECTTTSSAPKSTDLNAQGWTFTSLSAGHKQYVATGLRVYTDASNANGKSAGSIATNFALKDAGIPSLTFTNTTSGAVPTLSLHLVVNSVDKGYLTKDATQSKWTLTPALAALPAGGTLDEYINAFAAQGFTGDKVTITSIGYSLGANAKGDGIITSIKVGCVNYTFGAESVTPTVSTRVDVCYPGGQDPNRYSSKDLYITLSNKTSSVAVTFTVVGAKDVAGVDPTADIVRTVAAGQEVEVKTTAVKDSGVTYVVKFTAAGATIPDGSIEVLKFVGCLDGQPVVPSHTDQKCVSGAVVGGSITVGLLEGFTYTITGPNNFTWTSDKVGTVDGLAAGIYSVAVKANEGYVLTGDTKWPSEVEILEPVHCALVDIPVIPQADIACDVDGSYTLPKVDGVNWFVGGDPVDPNTYKVPTAQTVTVTAELADKTAGWTGGTAPKPWELVFAAPKGCVEPTLTGSTATGECKKDAPYISYNVTLTDPEGVVTTKEAFLVLSDGTHTEQISLGVLDGSGKLSGSILWPGVTVTKGVTTGWPGWVDNGSGKQVLDIAQNYGWTRSLTSAVIKVNPQVTVALTYPPATTDCANPPFAPPTHPFITPTATQKQLTCTSAGSYTLGPQLGALWTVNGKSVLAGTYPVTTSQVVAISAVPDAPDYGFEDVPNPFVKSFTFTKPSDADCGKQLTTLALTGVATSGLLMLGGGILFVGFVVVFIARRRRTAE